jgi:peptide/nickel transport system substrate-binding protein
MKNMLRVLFVCGVLLLTGVMTNTVYAQSVTIALGSEPTTLDPQIREDGGERAVNDNVYETLMVRTAQGALEPGLAAETPKLLDPTTWEVKLRAGVTFHNGEPFNADAVVFSIKRILDPAFNSEQISFFQTIENAEKVPIAFIKSMLCGIIQSTSS